MYCPGVFVAADDESVSDCSATSQPVVHPSAEAEAPTTKQLQLALAPHADEEVMSAAPVPAPTPTPTPTYQDGDVAHVEHPRKRSLSGSGNVRRRVRGDSSEHAATARATSTSTGGAGHTAGSNDSMPTEVACVRRVTFAMGDTAEPSVDTSSPLLMGRASPDDGMTPPPTTLTLPSAQKPRDGPHQQNRNRHPDQHRHRRRHAARVASWVRFLPAMMVYPVWLYIVTGAGGRSDGGGLWSDVFQYWPASIAMIFGSFVAGSTPLGGGVVAFPVSVLVLKFTAEESRDTSVLVQAVGMTAASFLLFLTKRQLLHGHIMSVSCFGGVLGVLLGLWLQASPAIINFIYTVTVLMFGALYFYTNFIKARTETALAPYAKATGVDPMLKTPGRRVAAVGPLGAGVLRDRVLDGCLFGSAVVGGFITGNVGGGSDMMLYVFGIYIWNVLAPEKRLSENCFTATSVVVMATMSIVTVLARALTAGFTPKVLQCWGAMAIVVCIGAPVGSMVLTPAAVPYLRAMFYVLAVVQFAMFAALKIQDNGAQWMTIACLVGFEAVALLVHFHAHRIKLRKRVARAAAAVKPVGAAGVAPAAAAAAGAGVRDDAGSLFAPPTLVGSAEGGEEGVEGGSELGVNGVDVVVGAGSGTSLPLETV